MNAGTTYAKGAVVGVSRRDALAELGRRQRAGLIHSAGEITLLTKGEHAGQYAIPVYVIMEPRGQDRKVPRWVWPVLATVLTVSVLLALLVWTLAALSGPALAMLLGTVLAAFLGKVWLSHGRRGHRTTVTTTVTID
ncbi:MAG TPA: hypothetical protein VFO13_09730 [Arthrobacter sp.]|nr:hypothetical protein [Arthrobacter sp.]